MKCFKFSMPLMALVCSHHLTRVLSSHGDLAAEAIAAAN